MRKAYAQLFQCNCRSKWTVVKTVNLQLHFEFLIASSNSHHYQAKSVDVTNDTMLHANMKRIGQYMKYIKIVLHNKYLPRAESQVKNALV